MLSPNFSYPQISIYSRRALDLKKKNRVFHCGNNIIFSFCKYLGEETGVWVLAARSSAAHLAIMLVVDIDTLELRHCFEASDYKLVPFQTATEQPKVGPEKVTL